MTRINQDTINPFGAVCRDNRKDSCVCINPSTWPQFTCEYIKFTKRMAESIKEVESCHPLVFMLRHSIELVLKTELIYGCGHLEKEVLSKKHNVKNLYDLFQKISCPTDALTEYIKEDEIKLFDKYDKGSYEFRYPVNITGSKNTCDGQCCFGLKETIEICDNLMKYMNSRYPSEID